MVATDSDNNVHCSRHEGARDRACRIWHKALAPKPLSHTTWHQAACSWAQIDSQEPAAGFLAQTSATHTSECSYEFPSLSCWGWLSQAEYLEKVTVGWKTSSSKRSEQGPQDEINALIFKTNKQQHPESLARGHQPGTQHGSLPDSLPGPWSSGWGEPMLGVQALLQPGTAICRCLHT